MKGGSGVIRKPMSDADLRYLGPQPDTSRRCRTIDTGLVRRSHGVPIYLPVYAGTKLYCLLTEATVEWRQRIEPMTASHAALWPSSCRSALRWLRDCAHLLYRRTSGVHIDEAGTTMLDTEPNSLAFHVSWLSFQLCSYQ